MRNRLVASIGTTTVAILLAACGTHSPSDKTSPGDKVAAQVTGSAPFCDLTDDKAVKEWTHRDLHKRAYPLHVTSNTKREVPQYRCTYTSTEARSARITTTAEQSDSSLVFRYIIGRYGKSESNTTAYAGYRSADAGLTKDQLKQLDGAQAILNKDDSLRGLIFKVGNTIIVDEFDGSVSVPDMNQFVVKQLAGLKETSER